MHPSAFEGTFKLSVNGLPADADVIAVEGKTYAKNSLLLPDWTPIDPADYGAPDPAKLMDPDGGFSGLLAAAEDVKTGDSVRGGKDNKEILTEYTGTISSDAVSALIPAAEGDFSFTYTISDNDELRGGRAQGRLLRQGPRRHDLHAEPGQLRHREGHPGAVSGSSGPEAGAASSPRVLLTLAAVAVAFAAADTYVVVLALPEMMGSVGIPIDKLQRAAPIVSGFLLGYVAMLPLIGRIADLRGRLPVLTAALLVFAAGSLVTALAYDLTSMVVGRFLQGVGGGGLVPATLALVADLYPVDRRGVPLGIVSAVQELGSVHRSAVRRRRALPGRLAGHLRDQLRRRAGPGAPSHPAVPSRSCAPPRPPAVEEGTPARLDLRSAGTCPTSSGSSCSLVTLVVGAIVFIRPGSLVSDLTWGAYFIPFAGDGRWLTPVGVVAMAGLALFLLRCATARRPLVDLRGWGRSAREADLTGAFLLAVALGGVILAFATADPKVQVFSDQGLWYLLGSAVATVALVLHLRRAEAPLLPRGALRRTPAWGAVVVSFFVGAALIAALIDIPIFARTTVYPDSQLMAALVLVRFLVALPVGAVVGRLPDPHPQRAGSSPRSAWRCRRWGSH